MFRLAQSLLSRPSKTPILYLVYIDSSIAESTDCDLGQQLLDSFIVPEDQKGKATVDVRRLAVPLSTGGLVETMLEHVSNPKNASVQLFL